MTIYDVAEGGCCVVGTRFCFPPMYAAFRGRKGWAWTTEVANAKVAEVHLAGDPGLRQLMDGLDDETRGRIAILRVGLKIGPAE